MPIAVGSSVLDDFLIVKTAPGLSAFENKFGSVRDGLELAETLREATSAARAARRSHFGPRLALELKRIVGEVICHCPLPAKISVPQIIDGRTTMIEVCENLSALLVDLALLDITHETRCDEFGCDRAIPNANQYCKIHSKRKARQERRCRRNAAENKQLSTKINNQEILVPLGE